MIKTFFDIFTCNITYIFGNNTIFVQEFRNNMTKSSITICRQRTISIKIEKMRK